jgi:feruloyl-CoA synthase
MLGAFLAGVPLIPISTAYSLLSNDHARVRQIAELCSPGMVFADDAEAYGPALEALSDCTACVAHGDLPGATAFAELLDAEPARLPDVRPDTVAKILFTSGSTGAPKGVINTHRMLCSNQQALGQIWPFLHEQAPTLVDWLPWSHTFGGNHNAGQVLAFGGTLYIDDGRPAPALFERTVQAIAHGRPTVYYNVPAGYALLIPRLEQDREFAEAFFSRLRFMFYAAAALPPDLWDRLRAVADDVADHDVALTASWGCTETAPAATSAHFSDSVCGCIGIPLPGVAIKLVPHGDKHEVRVLGPNVTPGYHRNGEATAAAFDADGYYRTGDAVRFVDPSDPSRGLMFDGRLAEDFKLITGTWVHVGKLRTELVSRAQVLSDAVICGHDRERVGALAWLNPAEARRLTGSDDIADPALRAHLARSLARLNAGAGSALRVERLLLLSSPPDIDAGEITDKGYLNQRAVRERRADAVEHLYGDPPAVDVIAPAE